MLPIFSYVINSGSVTIISIIVIRIFFSLVPWKYNSYHFSRHIPLFIQEQGRSINSLLVNKYHQSIQMCTHNIMLKQMQNSISVAFPIHIPDVPDISSPLNISTTSAYNEIHPTTYEHLHRTLQTQNQSKNKTITYKKYLMEIIIMVNVCHLLGRKKLVKVFSCWFEEDVISL